MYKQKIAIIFSFILLTFLTNGQGLHLPTDLIELAEKSSIKYNYKLTTNEIPKINRPIATFQKELVGQRSQAVHLKKGDKCFNKGKLKKARKSYKKALNITPSSVLVLSKIGDTYKGKESIEWYEKASIAEPTNPIIRWKFAIALLKNKKIERAKREIIFAHLYNRNHIEIYEDFKKIIKENNEILETWDFQPQCYVSANQKNITIHHKDDIWLAYGRCDAIWDYEPDYEKKMLKEFPEKNNFVREKECLMNALIVFEDFQDAKMNTQYPALASAGVAVKQGLLTAFVIYEIILPKKPNLINDLDDNQINNLLKYLNTLKIKGL